VDEVVGSPPARARTDPSLNLCDPYLFAPDVDPVAMVTTVHPQAWARQPTAPVGRQADQGDARVADGCDGQTGTSRIDDVTDRIRSRNGAIFSSRLLLQDLPQFRGGRSRCRRHFRSSW
jgi:hypothetical protein